MEHSDQNKNIQQQLNELQSFPDGINFNSAATWQKIEDSLLPEKKKKVTGWYLAAASVVLLCLLFLFIEKKNSLKDISGTIKTKKDTIALKPRLVAPSITLNSIPAAKEVILKKNDLVLSTKKNNGRSGIKDNVTTADNQAMQQQVLTATPEIIQELPAKTDTNASTVLAINKKISPPKLKIVHLNELGETVEIINEQEKGKLNTAWFFSNKNQSYDNGGQPALPSKKSIFTITLSSKNNN